MHSKKVPAQQSGTTDAPESSDVNVCVYMQVIQPVHVLQLAYRVLVAHILVMTDRNKEIVEKEVPGRHPLQPCMCPTKDTSLFLCGSANIPITNCLKII